MLDWEFRQGVLAAAAVSVTGTDLQVANAVLQLLDTFGPQYSAAFTPTVDAAKTAGDAAYATASSEWQTATSAKHVQADRACRYAESLAGTPGAPLSFDPASSDAIMARIAVAAALPAASTIAAVMDAHRKSVVAAYAAKPKLSYAPASEPTGFCHSFGCRAPQADSSPRRREAARRSPLRSRV